ncbi:MAG: thiolase family protein [Actinomycetota bacterium]|nr:thiolase family protein [Actinomycetota bacterium]
MADLRDAVYVDGVRVPIGRAGPKGYYAATRADDMVVRTIRALLDRNPTLEPGRIDDNVWAATTQQGDQALTIGRTSAILAGLPKSVPGYAVDRMCAGALTSITNAANAIRVGAQQLVIAGGVEHMGHHPMGQGADPNPRFLAEQLVGMSAMVMGQTAENLHDELPAITKERADTYAVQSQERVAKARAEGVFDSHVVRMAVWSDAGWRVVADDEHPRPGTTLEDLATLKTPFRPGGRVTAGNAAGLNDGAGCVLLADRETAAELGLPARMRLVDYTFVGVEPETMGYGPIPATERLLTRTGLADDLDVIEMNEAFAVQCVAFLDHFGLPLDTPKVNPYGGAIAMGHPLAMSGARLTQQVAYYFDTHDDARYGLVTLCVGLGMGCSVLWERL